MKKLFFLSFALFGLISVAQAQVSVGINFQTSDTFITVGTDADKEFFGEARLGIAHDLGLELMGGYNFVRKSEVNAYVGAGLGLLGDHHHHHHHDDHDDIYVAIPVGILVKPFSNTRNLGFLVEAAPVFSGHDHNYLRGGIGVKYTFR
ncbi:outer membrane insertion C- signal [Algoriphagus sp. H41]|uniref:Outer membrane insertion C- signal n=1 Tax=Algoriphagus oliviformis TaxID=2811231 RepID=A0ABS3C1J4_9BACT|nr:outer membrane insertion C- signal [Algoriphagus oliviformis]MBN7810031.1 outer membrane insertion C- signal [Algoriphagus oliviformis]